jgi:hypothetical protein
MQPNQPLTSTWKKPSESIFSVLNGYAPLEKQPRAIQSACSLHFYEAACEILNMKKEVRKQALEALPALVQPHVEQEIWRIWRLRNEV